MSVASAKGLVMFIVMNIASCQMPKVKWKTFHWIYLLFWCCSFWLKQPVVSCHSAKGHFPLNVASCQTPKSKEQHFLIFGPDFNVLIWRCSLLLDVSCQWPGVSCQCKGFGDVHCDEYCQLPDAKSKVQKFHWIYLLFWCCSFWLKQPVVSCHSAKGHFPLNVASCQTPKSKEQHFFDF